MKCINPNCGGEWTPPPGKSVTVCPFCGEAIAGEKKATQSFDNVVDTLIYIKEQYGADTLLSEKVYTYFADLTRNQLRDEKDLIKIFCEKGALDCLKATIGKPDSEHELAIKRALSRLPKYLHDSLAVTDMLCDFSEALGWEMEPISSPAPSSSPDGNNGIIAIPQAGSIINIADINWRVLTIENNKALLISEKIQDKRPFNTERVNTTWEQCTLRRYLNNEFYNKLGAMKSSIAETHNENPNNPWYGTKGGKPTFDKIFLLSIEEVIEFFGNSGKIKDRKKRVFFIDDEYNNNRIADDELAAVPWWLRSSGYNRRNAAAVNVEGMLFIGGHQTDDDCRKLIPNVSSYLGVRPALWLNLKFFEWPAAIDSNGVCRARLGRI